MKNDVTIYAGKVKRLVDLTEALKSAREDLLRDLRAVEDARRAVERAEMETAAVEMDRDLSQVILQWRKWEDAVIASGRYVRFSANGATRYDGGQQ